MLYNFLENAAGVAMRAALPTKN